MSQEKKICIIASVGGHLTQARALKPLYEKYQHFYVLNDRLMLPPDMEGRAYFVTFAERDLKLLVNLWEAWKILRKEKPDLIVSTGAGVVVPFALWAKLFRIPVIFVEDFTRMKAPSMTGKIMYHLSDRFFYQWERLARFFPKGEYSGPLI